MQVSKVELIGISAVEDQPFASTIIIAIARLAATDVPRAAEPATNMCTIKDECRRSLSFSDNSQASTPAAIATLNPMESAISNLLAPEK